MKLTTYDAILNEVIETELEGKLLKDMETEIARLAGERMARMELRANNAQAKTALLERLGITADEAALLLS